MKSGTQIYVPDEIMCYNQILFNCKTSVFTPYMYMTKYTDQEMSNKYVYLTIISPFIYTIVTAIFPKGVSVYIFSNNTM